MKAYEHMPVTLPLPPSLQEAHDRYEPESTTLLPSAINPSGYPYKARPYQLSVAYVSRPLTRPWPYFQYLLTAMIGYATIPHAVMSSDPHADMHLAEDYKFIRWLGLYIPFDRQISDLTVVETLGFAFDAEHPSGFEDWQKQMRGQISLISGDGSSDEGRSLMHTLYYVMRPHKGFPLLN